jgi:hypothetical protein
MTSPTQTFGDVLVVQDGAARLTWQPLGGGLQAPVGLWPDPAQRRSLERHHERRAPLLVVLAAAEPPVYLLPEEARRVPASMHRLVETAEHVCELRVPRLDWLPAPVMHRGRSFLEAGLDRTRTLPELLLPPLILEDAPDVGADEVAGMGPVRFACLTKAHSFPPDAWRDLAVRVFGGTGSKADFDDGGSTDGMRAHAAPRPSIVQRMPMAMTTGAR